MIKRILYFGNAVRLNVVQQQLQVNFSNALLQNKTIAFEDIGFIILDHYAISCTQAVWVQALQHNVAILVCDEKHMPKGLMLNLEGNHVHHERFQHQLSASEPLKKNLWQQTIQAKITNQGIALNRIDLPNQNFEYWVKQVKSGDSTNLEARAAAFYWKSIFKEKVVDFTRGRTEDYPNNFLNYGYAILRAVIARSLVASGLLPVYGIHHSNKYNAFCLADDIMEPYRPFVDAIVFDLMLNEPDEVELTLDVKKELLRIPATTVQINNAESPLMVAAQQTAKSLVQCFAGERKKIKYPTFSALK